MPKGLFWAVIPFTGLGRKSFRYISEEVARKCCSGRSSFVCSFTEMLFARDRRRSALISTRRPNLCRFYSSNAEIECRAGGSPTVPANGFEYKTKNPGRYWKSTALFLKIALDENCIGGPERRSRPRASKLGSFQQPYRDTKFARLMKLNMSARKLKPLFAEEKRLITDSRLFPTLPARSCSA